MMMRMMWSVVLLLLSVSAVADCSKLKMTRSLMEEFSYDQWSDNITIESIILARSPSPSPSPTQHPYHARAPSPSQDPYHARSPLLKLCIAILGYFGNVTSIILLISQFCLIIGKIKNNKPIPSIAAPYLVPLLNASLFFLYGLLHPFSNQMLSMNCLVVVAMSIIIVICIFNNPKNKQLSLWIQFLALLITVGVSTAFEFFKFISDENKEATLGLICIFWSFLSFVYRCCTLKSSSYSICISTILNSVTWLIFSLLVNNKFAAVSNAFMLLFGLVQFWKTSRNPTVDDEEHPINQEELEAEPKEPEEAEPEEPEEAEPVEPQDEPEQPQAEPEQPEVHEEEEKSFSMLKEEPKANEEPEADEEPEAESEEPEVDEETEADEEPEAETEGT
ncbi:hypothetical protein ACFE04_008139 [Oxalis oulophora]